MTYQPYSQSQFNITRIIIVTGLILVGYMIYNLTVTIYENYQIDLHIKNFESKNQQLQVENLKKLQDYKYYTSEAYIEKIAKQNLNLVNPGEEIIVITEGTPEGFSAMEMTEEEKQRSRAEWSNSKKWWTFIFKENPYRY